MSLKSLVTKSVNMAFEKAGDLAIIVLFNKKTVTDYDFTDQAVDMVDAGYTAAKGFEMKKRKNLPGQANNSTSVEMMFKTADVGNISDYSNATINGINYKFEPTRTINDFVTVLSFAREN